MMKIAGTGKMLTVLTILLVMSFFASERAFAWTVASNFEGGTIKTAAAPVSSGGFDLGNASTAYFSDTYANTGTKSAAMYFAQGVENVAGVYNSGGGFGEGHEIWYRAYFYFPSGWSWTSSPVVKMMRITMQNPATHHSVFADSYGQIVLSNEPGNNQLNTGVYWDTGRWQCVEMYVKLSTSSPIFRIWKDGKLIIEDTKTPTLQSGMTTDAGAGHLIFGNWNGGSPRNQTAYVDDIELTDVSPSQVDSKGNHMIGPTNGSTVPATIVPPAGLRVTAK